MRHEDGVEMKGIPHAALIDMRFHAAEDGVSIASVPYDPQFIGDAETGVIHGGIVTTALDSTCGIAAMQKTGMKGFVATLDLRVDYMRPAKPGKTIWARSECYRVTRSVAFCRGVAYEDSADDPVATAAGAFILSPPPRKGAK